MNQQMNKNKGFSLIELLIAVALLSIVMIMVTQFMGTTSGALSKTKKNLSLQTEAMEVGEQLSDALAQATYIRVSTQDGKMYKLDNQLNAKNRKARSVSDGGSLSGQLVVDNYPNYLKNGTTDRKIILNDTDYTLVDESGAVYPLSGDEDGTAVKSFRILTKDGVAGEPLYVKPECIYLRYQKKIDGVETEAYVIYYFKGNEIYMDRGDVSAFGTGVADGYRIAEASVKTKAAKGKGENGLLTECVKDCYLSADTEAETVFVDMLLEDSRYHKYTYNYAESVLLRNSNVLTVVPQKMFKKK
ncbi:MAG: prepilin-type N-terminal cleavage/methylation domain-containing protein [Clostridiales bacterium]|nr:prepilin-type N-terminal cleavage/methylation domain-containing protein [Clostridiales bacterium]